MLNQLFWALFLLITPFLFGEPFHLSERFNPSQSRGQPRLTLNNCPLAKINGKVISLIDVVKKMDLFLYEYNPNMEISPIEKIQYYRSRWNDTLEEMICQELVKLDAEQKELEVSDGEVREELEGRFGPNIMTNLETIGLQYEEARELIRSEIIIRQMMWYKVHSKVLQLVTPQMIKEAYQTYLEKNPPVKNWTYRVFSIRGSNQAVCQDIAKQAHTLLTNKKHSLDEMTEELKEKYPDLTITLSKPLSGETPSLSKQHYAVIKDLSTHSYSQPVSQISRFDKSHVSRIFYLDSLKESLPSDFDSMHEPLKNQLLNQLGDQEQQAYYEQLKKRYGFDQVSPRIPLPEDYQPFLIY